MTRLEHVARFDSTDDAPLVEASFCCQFCLHRPGAVIVGTEAGGGRAYCYCARCEELTEVALNADQVLRLTIAPPRGAAIHLVPADDL